MKDRLREERGKKSHKTSENTYSDVNGLISVEESKDHVNRKQRKTCDEIGDSKDDEISYRKFCREFKDPRIYIEGSAHHRNEQCRGNHSVYILGIEDSLGRCECI